MKTMFDAISRILIFSIWLYVSNEGQFSSWTTFGAFYILIAVMFAFNVIFNDSKNICSFEYWIGRFFIFLMQIMSPRTTPGLLFNTFSCVISYNHVDYKRLMKTIYGKDDNDPRGLHQSSFVKQTIYNLIIMGFMIG